MLFWTPWFKESILQFFMDLIFICLCIVQFHPMEFPCKIFQLLIRNTNIYNTFCEMFSLECVRMWSISVEELHVIWVACSWQNVWHDNLYWLSKFVTGICLCKIWFYLEISLPLWRKFILKWPSKNISQIET